MSISTPQTTVAPSVAPVTLAEAKHHLGLAPVVSPHDAMVQALIDAATRKWEQDTGQALTQTTFAESFDAWPVDAFRLQRRPLMAVTSIAYVDEGGATQTLSTSIYRVDANRTKPAIWLKWNQAWPAARAERNAITITYTAGFGDESADVPRDIRQALLLLVAQWFEQRTDLPMRTQANQSAYDAILKNHLRSDYP